MEDTKILKDLINQLVVNTKKLERAMQAENNHYMFVYSELEKLLSTQIYRETQRITRIK